MKYLTNFSIITYTFGRRLGSGRPVFVHSGHIELFYDTEQEFKEAPIHISYYDTSPISRTTHIDLNVGLLPYIDMSKLLKHTTNSKIMFVIPDLNKLIAEENITEQSRDLTNVMLELVKKKFKKSTPI